MRPCRRLVFAALLALSGPAAAQVNNPAYADYLLVGRFGEICTMCEAVVLCEAGTTATEHDSIPGDGRFTLYHYQTRTFWSQISTIWEWFIANFDDESLAARGHERPVEIYEIENGQWTGPRISLARLSLDPAVIRMGNDTIDRVDRRWQLDGATAPVGFCQRMPLWETLDAMP